MGVSDLSSATVPMTANVDAAITQQAQQTIRPLSSSDIQGSAQANPKFDKTLQDYEAVFLSQMVSHMSEGVGPDPVFGGGQAESTMKGLLYNEYGKMMAARGGIGLAAAMKKQLLAAQAEMAAKQAAVNPNAATASAAATPTATPTEGTE